MINDGFPIAISSIFKLGKTGKVLDQRNRFDFSRFLSHSCDPNCKINLNNSHQFEIDGKIVPGLIVTNCEVLDEHGEVLTVDFFKNFKSEVDKFFAPIRDPLIEEENGRMAYLIENKIDFVHCNCGADNCRQILFIDTQMIGKPENDRKTVYNNIPHNTRFKGTILF
ncbi:unnamed protein product [Caenorhabditis angaria]|uniref:Post-SET domain-containing protein n=1 Tax=Caenorhabditis angaria TaxID=860376 RepID=A0A9P1N6K6_9PELO|nr:unnamed protein product [Caenorhabditis angaria]